MTLPERHRTLARMLPLAGNALPASAAELTEALQAGLAVRGFAPARVTVEAPAWPAIGRLSIDFTGARITRHVQWPEVTAAAGWEWRCGRLEIVGAPLHFEGTPIELRLHADGVTLAGGRSGQGELSLTLGAASAGAVSISIQRADLEAALQRAAVLAAGDHGVEVKKTALQLTAQHSRLLAVQAEVTAKMFVMTAVVKLSGEISVDDALHARLQHLRVSADGMVGAMVNAVARPILEKWENREVPLLAFSLGGLKLRGIEVQGGEALHLEAQLVATP